MLQHVVKNHWTQGELMGFWRRKHDATWVKHGETSTNWWLVVKDSKKKQDVALLHLCVPRIFPVDSVDVLFDLGIIHSWFLYFQFRPVRSFGLDFAELCLMSILCGVHGRFIHLCFGHKITQVHSSVVYFLGMWKHGNNGFKWTVSRTVPLMNWHFSWFSPPCFLSLIQLWSFISYNWL